MSQFNVSNENKIAMLNQRLVELNNEGYNTEIAIVQIKAANIEESVEQLESNIEVIKAAIASIEAELTKLV